LPQLTVSTCQVSGGPKYLLQPGASEIQLRRLTIV
jgi:hypothetical protein